MTAVRFRYPRIRLIWRAPALVTRTCRTRGAMFGLVVIALVILLALLADVASPYQPNKLGAGIFEPPNSVHLLGTDQLGRDVLSRLIYGSRAAIISGLISVGLALAVGVPLGLVAGYWGGWVDEVVMRLVDTLLSFPTLVLALAIAASLGPGLGNAMIAIGIVFTPAFARLVRGQVLSLREYDFVMAAHVSGAGPIRIMWLHILPNVSAAIIVQSSLMIAQAIIVEASLSFLGLGIEPPNPSWGSMLRTGYQYMDGAIWLSVVPGAAIFMTVLGLNLLGDALRTALDPRQRQRMDL